MSGAGEVVPYLPRVCYVQPDDGEIVACDRETAHHGLHSWESYREIERLRLLLIEATNPGIDMDAVRANRRTERG